MFARATTKPQAQEDPERATPMYMYRCAPLVHVHLVIENKRRIRDDKWW